MLARPAASTAPSTTDTHGHRSRRVIPPCVLERRSQGRTSYVFAHNAASTAVHLFHLDQISRARVGRQRHLEPPADFDVDDLIPGAWERLAGGRPRRGRASLRPRGNRPVRQSFRLRSAPFTSRENGGVELRLSVASEVEMRPWVLCCGAQVEVLAPPSLRKHVADSMDAGARVYAGG